MQALFDRCAGLDVHKKTVVACRLIASGSAAPQTETVTFGTTTAELLRLSDWLTAGGVTHVALESTGVYWRPVYNLLEGNFIVWVLNAQHVKNVPGRKTDVKDAQWLADLLRHGLVRPSFIPSAAQRALRDLTRERTNFIRQRATLVNRVQKVLEGANIKLGDVASNVLGVSGRAILTALAAGQTDAATLAELAVGKLRSKRAALEAALSGCVRDHQRFVLTELLCQIESLEETIARFDDQIRAACAAEQLILDLLDTIPGVARPTAELLVAEIGTDLTRFPTAAHLAAWAGLAPGNDESAGKRRSGRIRQGNPWLRSGLVAAARGAIRNKQSALAAQYRRIAARRGDKRAIIAVAHSILVIAYHVITRQEPYRELGADYLDRGNPDAKAKRLIRQMEQLGFTVTVAPVAPAPAC
jgi:transposase